MRKPEASTAAHVRRDAVTIIGNLPDDPDQLPVMPPNGFIWMASGIWHGKMESYGLAEVRVSHAGKTLDFAMTLADAHLLRALLDDVIDDMRAAIDDPGKAGD